MQNDQLIALLRMEGYQERIISAFAAVDRAAYVPPEVRQHAYENTALPIGFGQTISQPSTIAFMLALLDAGGARNILEVGAGSGYLLALLAELAPQARIVGTERIRALAAAARRRLSSYRNIKLVYTPRTLGYAKLSPYDRIVVSAAAETVPATLVAQLGCPGVMVCPVDGSITSLKKTLAGESQEEFFGFSFVPLVVGGMPE